MCLRIYSNFEVSHSDDFGGGANALIKLLSGFRKLGGNNVIIVVFFIERCVIVCRHERVKRSGALLFVNFRLVLDFLARPTTL